MAWLRATTRLAIVLALATLVGGCAADSGRERNEQATVGSSQGSCPPPQEQGQTAQESTVATEFRKVTTIQNKTNGTVSHEPKRITAAVPNIYDGETKAGLSGRIIDDDETYRRADLRDGDRFEIAGIPFQIAIFPDRDEVTVCQLADDTDESTTPTAP